MKVGAMERAAAARSIAPTFMSVNMAVIEIMVDQSCELVTPSQKSGARIGSETVAVSGTHNTRPCGDMYVFTAPARQFFTAARSFSILVSDLTDTRLQSGERTTRSSPGWAGL